MDQVTACADSLAFGDAMRGADEENPTLPISGNRAVIVAVGVMNGGRVQELWDSGQFGTRHRSMASDSLCGSND
jgi:hypothetical protein